MTLLTLAWEFFLTGLFSVGGGLATLPFLKEMAEQYPWFTSEELFDMIAVSESTPGPIGVNMATFAGYKAFGLSGGVVATVALVTPSVIVIILIARFMESYAENPLVQKAFYTLRPTTMGLIAGAVLDVFLMAFFLTADPADMASLTWTIKVLPLIMFFAILYLIHKKPQIHPIIYILAGAVAGVVFQF